MRSKLLKTLTTLALSVCMVISVISAIVFGVGANGSIDAVAAAGDSYQLVTDESTLAVEDKIIIVASGKSNFALSTTQNGNNRGQEPVKKNEDGSTINNLSAKVQVIKLEKGTKNDTFAFYVEGEDDNAGYLYAASSKKNYLRTETTLSDNSSWTITISNGVATIKAQGTNTRNWLRYNSTDDLFSCYTSGQQDVSIYKLYVCEHTNTTKVLEVAATCTTHGTTAGVVCSACGEVVSGCEEIPATGHAWTETSRQEATCTEDGSVEYKCSNCPETKKETLPATGHKNENSDGQCDVCGANLCTEHTWRYIVLTEANCTTAGEKQQVCKNCGEIGETSAIPATGHTEVIDEAVAATCTATGLTEGKHCSVCGEVLDEQTTTPIIEHTYVDDSCTMCGKTLSFKVGDIVFFTGSQSDGTTYELTGFANGAKFGTATKYTGSLAGTFPITVVDGNQSGTYAFKNDEYYIARSGSDIKLATTLNDDASWIVELDDNGNLVIKSYSGESNKLQFNASNPRFKTYTSNQQPIKVLKVTDPVVKGVALSLNKGITVKVKYVISAAWLALNEGAKVVFSNGQEFAATAGENVYSVDLTPAQINDKLTVKIKLADGTDFGEATDVSVSTYRTKVEAAYANDKLGYSEEKYNALIALLDAAITYSNAADDTIADAADDTIAEALENDFTGVGDLTIVHGDEAAKLFTGCAGTLSTYASVRIIVNTENIQEGDKLIIRANGQKLYNGDFAGALNADNQIVIDGIYPLNFNDTIYIDATTEGSVAEITFNAYLKAVYNSSSDHKVKNMAVATYWYGQAAEAFFVLS